MEIAVLAEMRRGAAGGIDGSIANYKDGEDSVHVDLDGVNSYLQECGVGYQPVVYPGCLR